MQSLGFQANKSGLFVQDCSHTFDHHKDLKNEMKQFLLQIRLKPLRFTGCGLFNLNDTSYRRVKYLLRCYCVRGRSCCNAMRFHALLPYYISLFMKNILIKHSILQYLAGLVSNLMIIIQLSRVPGTYKALNESSIERNDNPSSL